MKKIIITLGLITGIHLGISGQSKTESSLLANNERHIVYSEEHNALVFQDSVQTDCSNIIIKSLPPLSNDNTPIHIVFPKGKFTFAKCQHLSIPGDYRIYIEDIDAEKIYNLNLSESHSFKASNEEILGRFILHIERPGTKS